MEYQIRVMMERLCLMPRGRWELRFRRCVFVRPHPPAPSPIGEGESEQEESNLRFPVLSALSKLLGVVVLYLPVWRLLKREWWLRVLLRRFTNREGRHWNCC